MIPLAGQANHVADDIARQQKHLEQDQCFSAVLRAHVLMPKSA